jgi:hypothetical protein
MNTKFLAVCIGIAFVATGCIRTVTGRNTGGVPFVKDRFEGRYERTVDQVFGAAKLVITENGVLLTESTLHGQVNDVRVVEGKVNQRNVWIRVEGIDPKPITAVTVQARTKGGGSDMGLVHELEKQIALKLAR